MFSRLSKWLEPPIFPGDEPKTQLARLVNTLGHYFVLSLLIVGLVFVPFFALYKVFVAIVCTVMLGLYFVARRLLYVGRIQFAAALILGSIWATFECIMVLSGGITSPASLIVVTIVVLTGMSLDLKIGRVLVALSVLAATAMAVLQANGIEFPQYILFTPLTSWFWHNLPLIFAFAIVREVMNHFRQARQQAESALLGNQARLQQAQNLAQLGVWEWDPATDVTIWSDEMLKIYGITRAEFTGRGGDYFNFTLPEDRPIQRENVRRDFEQASQFAAASGKLVDEHPDPKAFRIVRKDGSIRWVRGDAVEVVDGQGKPLRMHGILWDVTDQMLAEQKLRASEAKFRAIVEHSHDGVIFLDSERTILYASPSYCQINGFTPEELIGRRGIGLVHPDDLALTQSLFGDLLKQPGETVLAEYRVQHKDGSYRWVETKATNLLDEPAVQAVVINSRDSTDRKRAEEEILKLKLGIEHSNDAIFVTDPQGKIIYTNPAFEKVYGYGRDEAIGNTPRLIKSGLIPQGVYQDFWETLLGKKSVEGEIVNRTKDGRIVIIEGSNNPILDAAGRIIGFLAIHRDITDRKRAEDQLQLSEMKYRELFNLNKDGISIFILFPDGPANVFVEINEAAHQMLGYTREEMLKMSPHLLELETSPEVLLARQVELQTSGIVHFETVLAHKDGHRVYAEFTSQIIQYEGRLAVMNIVHDLSERKQRELELQAIASLSAALRTAVTRVEMFPVIVENLVEILNADAVSIEIIEPATGDAIVESAHGAWKSLEGSCQPKGTGMNEVIRKTLKPYHAPRLDESVNSVNPAWIESGMRETAGVPLIAQEQLIGFIWMGRQTEITESQFRLLSAVADIAANAIHRSTLHEQTLNDAAALNRAYDTTLEGWARALELRDQETEGHSQRVTTLTLELARQFNLEPASLVHIRRGAILHDIGKMGIPDSILHKPDKLSEEEWAVMRKHPQYAYEMLTSIEHLRPAIEIPYCHHEKWDGSGYPRGLKGEEIPLAARIFAVVDVWDALRTDRVYRPGWQEEKVLEYIRDQAGSHFDPQVVERFLRIIAPQD